MSDILISRQAAYETLTAYYHHKHISQHIQLKDALDKVPPAEPRWIPVTERLPKRGENIFAYFIDGFIRIGHLSTHGTEDNNFEMIGIKIGVEDVWYTDRWCCNFDRVSAWMPLPKPYKGGAE